MINHVLTTTTRTPVRRRSISGKGGVTVVAPGYVTDCPKTFDSSANVCALFAIQIEERHVVLTKWVGMYKKEAKMPGIMICPRGKGMSTPRGMQVPVSLPKTKYKD